MCLLPFSDFSAVPAILRAVFVGDNAHIVPTAVRRPYVFLLLPAPKVVSGAARALAPGAVALDGRLHHLDAAVANSSGIGGLPAALLVHRLTAFPVVFYPASRRPLPAWRPSIPWPGHPPGSLELLLLSGTRHHILCRFGSRLLHHGIDRTLA